MACQLQRGGGGGWGAWGREVGWVGETCCLMECGWDEDVRGVEGDRQGCEGGGGEQ